MDAMPQRRFDPLASVRSDADAGCDLLLTGTVFQDIIFTGLPQAPEPGTEVWSEGMGSCPGGVANQAIAAARLGLRTNLAATFGDDGYGDYNWQILEKQEHVDLSLSQRVPGWHSPVTVSMCVNQDRSMVTHGHPAPISASQLIGQPPRALAAVADLEEEMEPWMLAAMKSGTKLFGVVGWDPTGKWSERRLDQLENFYAFLPNAPEAMAFTGKSDPWAALYSLADRVPVAVVTLGPQGAVAVDSESGEEEWVPSLPVPASDPTGAGDCFGAAFIVGCLAGWRLGDRLRFANLCASLAVQEVGGSLAAPGWGDIADWWQRANARKERQSSQWLRRFAFLEPIVKDIPAEAQRRARATIAHLSDAQ
ncbi:MULTISPECIES: carbohydrate kinase family protein [Paenarthrobacter]|uniref:Sugar/nucleoside kinase (Ribokinase family) n=1 Tax=Paenarthrobacter nicotinovorans TaxID=29320 RepID=A0ABT9TGY3_PAENI|nr:MULTISPECIES: carbohydrate kinase family protein [Paenarthrobacter]KQR07071.1 carbohydrate kinase [Arthrobacter sp. Leaf145]MBP2395836.1 sugar/nucleoside kinase (ribokinase family) [Paenarthrobacter nicotinovorans]MDQ0100909.1 sugar/nucleoside kinase (ribokinase family) [Paenarthrobacter nicotinovorans]UKE98059.1 carbohydrate kinase family protein [Paenarthrobacter nicotinovorans]UKF02846.1 carbohydrate kinase family protein [Paenarthrobacter nicotinovorans]